ncbi:hypothetical protein [uncultured Aliivibrio sp.]|uniref:hypothetical protein n=1 Tax=uncultured Aliivibrio sp. TaxID=873085 RepID=UPI00260E9A9F|nr:hypothetical protein [uncultured Aliivibrio sp.]
MDSFQKTLGKDVANCYIPLVENVLANRSHTVYHFMSHSDFKVLEESDVDEANAQYIKEILFRSHFASMSSIAKNLEWIKGMKHSYENGLYLPFSSSMRSLIESTADSFDALLHVSITLAEHNKVLNKKLQKGGGDFVTLTELENVLIHYSHARRLEKGEKAPTTHKAKQPSEYIRDLDSKTGQNFYELYGELCQLTHPAAQGVLHMMPAINESEFFFDERCGKEKIELLLERNKDLIPDLIAFAFNPGLLTLKVLNYLKLNICHSEYLKVVNFDAIPAWGRCKKHLGV